MKLLFYLTLLFINATLCIGNSDLQINIAQVLFPQNLETRDLTMSGNKLAVGSRDNVFTYQWNGTFWIQDEEILKPGIGLLTVTMRGDKLAVGLTRENEHRGAVFTYRFDFFSNRWVQNANVLRPIQLQSGDYFGESLSISGNKLAVGAPYTNNGAGAVYTFQWDENEMLWNQDPIILHGNGKFGISVSISASSDLEAPTLVIGAPDTDNLESTLNKGAVHFYVWTGVSWILQQNLVISTTFKQLDHFGEKVSLYDDKLVVGSPPGSVVTYQLIILESTPQWSRDPSRTLPTPFISSIPSNFGSYVSMNQHVMIASDTLNDLVQIYVWENEKWTFNNILKSHFFHQGRIFYGINMAISENHIAIASEKSIYTYTYAFPTAEPTPLPTPEPTPLPTPEPTPLSAPISTALQINGLEFDSDFEFDRLGYSLGLYDNIVAVGVPFYNDNRGCVLIYIVTLLENDQWSIKFKTLLSPSNLNPGDEFGSKLAIGAKTLAISTDPKDIFNPDDGSVYIYYYSKLNDDEYEFIQDNDILKPSFNEYFGFSISIFGDNMAIGAPTANNLPNKLPDGRVYMYQLFEGKYVLKDIINGNGHFGTSVSINDGFLSIGSIFENNMNGTVHWYAWNNTNWNSFQIINTFDLTEYELDNMLGWSVSMYGNFTAVSSNGLNNVYMFYLLNNKWTLGETLNIEDNELGWSISIHGNLMAVSAIDDDNNKGIVNIYRVLDNELTFVQALIPPPEIGPGGKYGWSVSVFNNHVAISSPFTEQGRVYLYYIPEITTQPTPSRHPYRHPYRHPSRHPYRHPYRHSYRHPYQPLTLNMNPIQIKAQVSIV